MKLKPHALLFDLDGVLVNSLDAWWSALNEALQTYNHPGISRHEFVETYWGHDVFDNLERLGLSEEVGFLCNRIYYDHVNRVSLYPGVLETLEQLHMFKKGLITNTPRSSADLVLTRFHLTSYFDVIITSNDVKKAKPHPEIVMKACTALKINPEQAVLIGDTQSDVQAGKAAGCTVIGVNIQADYKIQTVSELPDIVQGP